MLGFAEQTYETNTTGENLGNKHRNLMATREASRTWSVRIITLSSAIIAFSVSVVSIEFLQSNLSIEKIKLSWIIFIIVIILGTFNLIFESRTAYAITLQDRSVDKNTKFNWKDYVLAIPLLFFIIVFPLSSLPSKIASNSSAIAYNWLFKIFSLVLVLEIATFFLFVLGLWYFVQSLL